MWEKITKNYIQLENGISLFLDGYSCFFSFFQYIGSIIPGKNSYNVPLNVQGPHAMVETNSHKTLKSYHQETIPLVWTFTLGASQQS